MADYLSGLLAGFQGRKSEVEQQHLQEGVAAGERENKVFSTLLGSDDPEVQHLALAGLLDSANPRKRKSGLAGWIGQTQASPYLAQIQHLIGTPVTKPNPAAGDHPPLPSGVTQTLPSTQSVQGVPLAPSVQPAITDAPNPDAPAAMADTALTQQSGQAPPKPTTYTQTAAPPVPYSITQPRQVFSTPEEKYRSQAMGKAQGDVEGAVSGYVAAGGTREEGLAIERAKLARGGAGGAAQSIAGEIPDGKGGWQPAYAIFDRTSYRDPNTGQAMLGFRPKSVTASSSWGVDLEPLAMAVFGKRGNQLTQPEASVLLTAKQAQKNQLTTEQALSQSRGMLPNATLDQQMALADYLRSSTAASPGQGQPVPGGPPAPAGVTPVGTSAPAATPGAPTGAGAPTAAGGPPAPTGSKLGAGLDPALAAATKESGKPLPPAVATALAKAKSTNDLIDQALTALEPFKADNTLQGSIDLTSKYRQGQYDPITSAAAQLSDLAGLQSSAQAQLTGGGSRALRFYVDRRQHVPRLPSGRQGIAAGILPGGAGTVQTGSILLKGDEAGFDTPQMMYQKLQGAKANNDNFIREIEAGVREPMNGIAPMSSHGGPPVPSSSPSGPSSAPTTYKDAQGHWHIATPDAPAPAAP